MKQDIGALRNEGIAGIVTGILRPDDSVDIARTRELVDLAAPLKVAFHRAFDETPDLTKALEDVILVGANRILTSGGAPDALQGASVLRGLIKQAASRLIILPGGGIHPENITEVIRATGASEIHTGLGTVIPYSDLDTARFELAVRACVAAL